MSDQKLKVKTRRVMSQPEKVIVALGKHKIGVGQTGRIPKLSLSVGLDGTGYLCGNNSCDLEVEKVGGVRLGSNIPNRLKIHGEVPKAGNYTLRNVKFTIMPMISRLGLMSRVNVIIDDETVIEAIPN